MSNRWVKKMVTLNDLEWSHGRCFALFHRTCVRYKTITPISKSKYYAVEMSSNKLSQSKKLAAMDVQLCLYIIATDFR